MNTATTYTLDAEMNGRFFSDYGLTAEEISNARSNADRLGIRILAVIEERPVSMTDLTPFGVAS